jgi:ABC-type thiamin/hydroxymethylpyrimidine transport system permease subunit
MTILVGIGGSLIGGLIGALLFRNSQGFAVILEVIAAAGIVYFMQRREVTR